MNLQEQFALKMVDARKAYEAGDLKKGDELKAEAEQLKSAIKGLADLSGMETETKTYMRPTLPGKGEGAEPTPNPTPEAEAKEDTAQKAVYAMRFGEQDAIKSAVYGDLIGKNYQEVIWEQARAFNKFLRRGTERLNNNERDLLDTQIFPFEDITEMVKLGYSVAEIKATMVEAQGTLGGYAVPTSMQSEILRRLPGLTAIRGAGASVINLTTGNSTEYLEVTGGDDRYTSGLRGSWGSETQNPTEKNLTFGLKRLNADVYTYKVPMSQSLIDDASNLISILQQEAVVTLAIDEDEAFTVGDGVGKPLGILPGGLNTLSLGEVASESASSIEANGVWALKRALPSQYRSQGNWFGNSETFGIIERLVDGNGNRIFPDMSDVDQLLQRKIHEAESMPDVAASAYPLLFGAAAGYTIVERSGMTIARFQDSNTGINKVEFQFRRRVGGRVTKPWMFRVMKIAETV